MAYSPEITSPFRAKYVGSFLRPLRPLEAARARKAEKIKDTDLARVQDDFIAEIVAFQDNRG